MGEILLLIRENTTDDASRTDYFASTAKEHELALREAIQDFLKTPDGKKAMEQTDGKFNWGDALTFVPESLWEKHGLTIIKDGDYLNESAVKVKVSEREVLVPDNQV